MIMLLPAFVTGCSTAPQRSDSEIVPAARSADLVYLDFEDRAAPVGEIVPGVTNKGTADVGSEVVTYAGGRITLTEGWDTGYAVRFPGYSGSVEAPAAMLLLRSREEADPLSPGTRDFSFGADVRLDDESSGPGSDNGDNVFQRGTFEDPAQFKLQVDRAVPSCRVAGSEGAVLVSAADPIAPGEWLRLICERRGDVVSLTVELLGDATTSAQSTQATVEVGVVDFERSTPLVVGGKVDAEGRGVPASTDQFNGTIDNVSFKVLG